MCLACKTEREGQGRLECGGPQLGMQWRPNSDKTWDERGSGGVVPTSAGGGREADEEERGSQSDGNDEEGGSGMGRTAGGFGQAVGIRDRQGWYRYKVNREQLVGITGQRVQADGGSEVLVEGQEVWEEWTGQTDSGRHRVEGEGQGAVEGEGASSSAKELGKLRTWKETRCMTEVENGQRHGRRGALAAPPCYVWSQFYYPLLIVNLLIYSIKMICTTK